MVIQLILLIVIKKDISILDLGCGLGYFLSALNTNFKKYGIEDSEFACNYIRENFKDIEIINGDYTKIKNFKKSLI